MFEKLKSCFEVINIEHKNIVKELIVIKNDVEANIPLKVECNIKEELYGA